MQPRRAITACRGAGIELFSDRINHGGGIFTRPGLGSQALFQHFWRDITFAEEEVRGVWVAAFDAAKRRRAAISMT